MQILYGTSISSNAHSISEYTVLEGTRTAKSFHVTSLNLLSSFISLSQICVFELIISFIRTANSLKHLVLISFIFSFFPHFSSPFLLKEGSLASIPNNISRVGFMGFWFRLSHQIASPSAPTSGSYSKGQVTSFFAGHKDSNMLLILLRRRSCVLKLLSRVT